MSLAHFQHAGHLAHVFYRCVIGFRSRVWTGSFQNLDLVLVRPLLWVVVIHLNFFAETLRFCAKYDWYLVLVIIASTLNKAPVPDVASKLESFTVRLKFFLVKFSLCQTYVLF